jgi:hypothetical protein
MPVKSFWVLESHFVNALFLTGLLLTALQLVTKAVRSCVKMQLGAVDCLVLMSRFFPELASF